MEQRYFVWVTARRVKRGAREALLKAWRPGATPAGMRHAYALWSLSESEVIGVSFWDSEEACTSWRASEEEKRRQEAMAPHVLEETNDYYAGGELVLP
jgi:heme-degrading monooxygenase HmoA